MPLIISSDKTQLTTFRGKKAYPVYLTIGNIPKHIRRKPSRQSQVLLAYLPTSTLGHITNKASHRRCLSNLFHHCMQYIVKPMESARHDGILLVSGDGAVRRCFLILVAYVGDYLEQTLVTLVKNSNCPICPVPRENIGDWESKLEPHDMQKIIEVLNSVDEEPLNSPKHVLKRESNLFSVCSGKIFPSLTSTTLSHLISFINYTKAFSNTSSLGFGLHVEMQRLMLGVIICLIITTSDCS